METYSARVSLSLLGEITVAKLSNGEVLSIIPEPTMELPMIEGEEESDGFYLGTFLFTRRWRHHHLDHG